MPISSIFYLLFTMDAGTSCAGLASPFGEGCRYSKHKYVCETVRRGRAASPNDRAATRPAEGNYQHLPHVYWLALAACNKEDAPFRSLVGTITLGNTEAASHRLPWRGSLPLQLPVTPSVESLLGSSSSRQLVTSLEKQACKMP